MTFPRFALAPLAGYADMPFREACAERECEFGVTEMVSCRSIINGADREVVRELLARSPREKKLAVQLFGSVASDFADAVSVLYDKGLNKDFDALEINMGCPAPKVVKTFAGSALLLDLPRAASIIRATVRAARVPVGIKIRSGFSDSRASAELAKIALCEGVSYITIHGRTKEQMFKQPVDFLAIENVKRIFGGFVYGNGDVKSQEQAREMMDKTGCDGVMIGRAALCSPWIFAELQGQVISREDKLMCANEYVNAHVGWKGEIRAIPELRGRLMHMFQGVNGAKRLRRALMSAETLADINTIIYGFFNTNI